MLTAEPPPHAGTWVRWCCSAARCRRASPCSSSGATPSCSTCWARAPAAVAAPRASADTPAQSLCMSYVFPSLRAGNGVLLGDKERSKSNDRCAEPYSMPYTPLRRPRPQGTRARATSSSDCARASQAPPRASSAKAARDSCTPSCCRCDTAPPGRGAVEPLAIACGLQHTARQGGVCVVRWLSIHGA